MGSEFDFSNILDSELSDEEKEQQAADLEKDVASFDLDESDDFTDVDIPSRTSVRQGDNKLQDVDAITKDRAVSSEQDEVLFDVDGKIVSAKKEEGDTKEDKTPKNETKEDKEDKSDDKPDDKPDSLLLGFAEDLVSEGLIDATVEDLADIKTAEDLKNFFVEKRTDKEYSDLSEEQTTYLNAIRNGIPEPVVKQQLYIMDQLNKVTDDVIESNEEVATDAVVTLFKQKGFSDEKASSYVAFHKQNGTLNAEAKDAVAELKEIKKNEFESKLEAEATAKENAKKEEETFRNEVKETFTSGEHEIIPGVKVPKNEGQKIYKQMITPVAKTKDGKVLNAVEKFAAENPKEYKMALNYLFAKGFFNGKPDIKGLEQSVKTKTTSKFEKLLKGESKTLDGGGHRELPTDQDDVDALIDAI